MLIQIVGTKNYCEVINGRVSIVNSLKARQAFDIHRQHEIQGSLEMVSGIAWMSSPTSPRYHEQAGGCS